MKKVLFSVFITILLPLTIFASSGTGTSALFTLDTVDPEVTVIDPNGGEELYIDDSHDITWSADDFGLISEPIAIEFSSDNGNTYTYIDSSLTNDGIYAWEIPEQVSNNCLVKIYAIDSFGNIGEDVSDNAFSIEYIPPASPTWIEIDLSNETDAVISWASVDTTIFGTPITVDGYIVLYNETPYEDDQYYYFLTATDSTTTSYTHTRVVEFRDQMFYKVLAYKDYTGDIGKFLDLVLNRQNNLFAEKPRQSLRWLEIKERF